MGTRSRGRGTAGALGFLLLIAGLVGGGVLYALSLQRPDKAVEGFARAAAGCTTTLDFSETGTFYVYEEVAGDVTVPEGGCVPTPSAGERFTFVLTGPATVTTDADATVTYDSGDFAGTSVARFEIDTPGLYEIAVVSEDVGSVAAVGRDPDSGIAEQQRNAVIVGAVGGLLGLLLLTLAGRRSRRASTVSTPEGPTRTALADSDVPNWPASTPAMPRVPINPQQPDSPVEATPPPPPLPAREPGAGVPLSPWSAPPAGGRPVSSEPPAPPPPVRTPQPIPVLPAAPASVSGAWPPSTVPPPPPAPSPQGSPPPPPPPPPPR